MSNRRARALLLCWLVPSAACSRAASEPAPSAAPAANAESAAATAAAAGAEAPAVERPPPAPPAPVDPEPPFAPARAVTLAELPWQPEFAAVRAAEDLIERGAFSGALAALGDAASPAAHLMAAKAYRGLGELELAQLSLLVAGEDDLLGDWVALEQGLIYYERGAFGLATGQLLDVLATKNPLAPRAAGTLAEAMVASEPALVLQHFARLEAALPDEISARSLLLAAKARALRALGREAEATEVDQQRFLEEPVAPETPTSPPAGVTLTPAQLLARAEVLLAAHRNERVLEALSAVEEAGLGQEERCRFRFGRGLAHRKLHHYSSAEADLSWVVAQCADADLARRAAYVAAKVISIRGGLRAIGPIEAFAKRFAGHSMVDDVLFWAGDLYQRRDRDKEAAVYYTRIVEQTEPGDYCADARWRLAWMAYRRGELERAAERLAAAATAQGCASTFDRARATYWSGRVAAARDEREAAINHYERTVETSPLGFYGQLAVSRLLELAPASREERRQKLHAPPGGGVPALCPGWLASRPEFERAVSLLTRGLGVDAAATLLALAAPEQQVIGKSHAATQGLAAQGGEGSAAGEVEGCGAADPALLLALLLDQAGAHRDSHWRLRTEFAEVLEQIPGPEQIGLFRAAYPLAHRAALGGAEEEHQLPSFFLQALSREESAFDAEVVSWAGAYGLTQLLLSTGQRAGKLLKPPVKVEKVEQLLDPVFNARLGGAYVASLLARLHGNPALVLVAYNAGERYAKTLWKRHQGQPFDRFVEEITIRETRGYVKRVLRTFGVYRWLYGSEAPELPIAAELPPHD